MMHRELSSGGGNARIVDRKRRLHENSLTNRFDKSSTAVGRLLYSLMKQSNRKFVATVEVDGGSLYSGAGLVTIR